MTSIKRMKKISISLINEIVSKNQIQTVKFDFSNTITVWFYNKNKALSMLTMYYHLSYKENLAIRDKEGYASIEIVVNKLLLKHGSKSL